MSTDRSFCFAQLYRRKVVASGSGIHQLFMCESLAARGGVYLIFMHGRSRMTIYPRILTMPGRSESWGGVILAFEFQGRRSCSWSDNLDSMLGV